MTALFRTPGRILGYYILVQTVFSVMIGVFEIPLVLRLTSSVQVLALVYILYNAALLLAFFLVPRLFPAEKISRILRFSLLIQIAFCAFVIVFYSRLADLGLLCGFFALLGFQDGTYWRARDSGILYAIEDRRRDGFLLKLQSAVVALSVLVPVASGFVISYVRLPFPLVNDLLPQGYLPVFVLILVFLTAAWALAPRLQFAPQPRADFRRSWALFRKKGMGAYNAYLLLNTAQAMVVAVGVTYLTFTLLKTEFNLAVFLAVLSLLATVYFLAVKKLTARGSFRERFVLWGTVGVILSRLTYLFWFSFFGLVVKSVFDTFLVPFKDLFADNTVKSRTERIQAETGFQIVEIMAYQEILLFAARFAVLLFILVFMALSRTDPVVLFQALLLVFGLGNVAEFFLLKRMNRPVTSSA